MRRVSLRPPYTTPASAPNTERVQAFPVLTEGDIGLVVPVHRPPHIPIGCSTLLEYPKILGRQIFWEVSAVHRPAFPCPDKLPLSFWGPVAFYLEQFNSTPLSKECQLRKAPESQNPLFVFGHHPQSDRGSLSGQGKAGR